MVFVGDLSFNWFQGCYIDIFFPVLSEGFSALIDHAAIKHFFLKPAFYH